MTWEPTDAEIDAYVGQAQRTANLPTGMPWTPDRAQRITRGGLRAAYALLEQRVNAGEVLGQPLTEHVHGPDAWEYYETNDVMDLAEHGAKGWRLEHALADPRDGTLLYILERPIRG